MSGWQQTIVVGNVGRDPELKYFDSGTAVANFTIAVNETWMDQQTQQQREKTTWYRVAVWGRQAETVKQFVTKGRQVMVIGTVEARGYLDANNQPAASLELRARDVRFLGGREEGGQRTGGGYEQQYQGAPPDNLGDIPF